MHEGTPDVEDVTMEPRTPLAVEQEQTQQLEQILREVAASPHKDMELEFNSELFGQDGLATPPAPPPPPPPPPPQRPRAQPTDLVAQPLQFLPPQKTKQQIQLAKAQLEAQLGGQREAQTREEVSVPTRAGPKGQFIWPPVSVQSGGGTVSIRARTSLAASTTATCTSTQGSVMSSTTPVAQLAAVFSSPHTPTLHTLQTSSIQPMASPSLQSDRQPAILSQTVMLPQEPVPVSELGLTFNVARPQNHQPSFATLPTTLPVAPSAEAKLKQTEDVVKQQQQQIEELQRALAKSQQQLQTQQVQVRSGEQHQPTGAKQLLAHQLQSRQLANQIQQLQEQQHQQQQLQQQHEQQQLVQKQNQVQQQQQMVSNGHHNFLLNGNACLPVNGGQKVRNTRGQTPKGQSAYCDVCAQGSNQSPLHHAFHQYHKYSEGFLSCFAIEYFNKKNKQPRRSKVQRDLFAKCRPLQFHALN